MTTGMPSKRRDISTFQRGRRALVRFAPALLILAFSGCRGKISEKPPIHINPNMDNQERFEAQERNAFFADLRAMRPPVPGTVARGELRDDPRLYLGRNPDGTLVEEIPLPVTGAFMERGRDRFDIYCAVCHGPAGDGRGIIATGEYGMVPPTSYHSDALRAVTDGHLYEVISRGIRTMPSYGSQIPVADRWAIVAYVRALQLSQHASSEDVPPAER